MVRTIDDKDFVILLDDDRALLSVEASRVITLKDTIGEVANAFAEGNQEIEGVILGDNITTLGDKAFFNCSNIKFVILGKGLKTIGQCAFTGNAKLKYVFYNGRCEDFLNITMGEPFESVGLIHCINGDVKTVNYQG